MRRSRSILVALLLASVVLAGCTKDEGGDGDAAPPGNDTPGGVTPPTGNGTGQTPGTPQTAPVTDQGAVQGPFSKTWALNVPVVSPRQATVLFNLTGAQAGTPPTARLHLEFVDPEGNVLKSTDVGLGAAGNSVTWTFGPADLPTTGDYTIRAVASTSPAGPGVPSGGLGNYQLYAHVEY